MAQQIPLVPLSSAPRTPGEAELFHALETIQPELMAMTRLFSLPDSLWGPPPAFALTVRADADAYTAAFTDGELRAEKSAAIPSEADPDLQALHRRRAARRLCKQALYALCREKTGFHPPWGSLTGVRPTHLMLESLAAGLSPAEAVDRLVTEFDVTRDKAELLAEIAGVQQALPAPGDGWMDVYVGIPFCTTRCAYCSFSSGEIGDGRLLAPFMDALEREIRACAGLPAATGRRLRALYVGGGTPTALPEPLFERLLALLGEYFPGTREVTVEAGRPDTITRAKLRAIRAAKVSRISVNPQTMNDRTLRLIGRAHTAAQVREAYAMAREEGIGHINMDVIAGLPGETEADFGVTMEEALALRPESLTVHTLALKRSSRMSLEKAPLPDGDRTARMVQAGRDTARRLGMVPYYLYRQKYMAGNQENTGYALPGRACLYNVDMMEETTHILAFGAGGISKRIWPSEGRITRAPNVGNIEEYIARADEMARRKQDLFLPGHAEEGGTP